jgi:hypothetical protein
MPPPDPPPLTLTEIVTLIAAAVGAITGLASLGIQWYLQHRASHSESVRSAIAPFAADLGDSLHQVLACSRVALRRGGPPNSGWRSRGSEAAKKLKELRHRTFYVLNGCQEGLRTIARIPDWSCHLVASNPDSAHKLLDHATELRTHIDAAVSRALFDGGRPTRRQIAAIDAKAALCRGCFEQSSPASNDDHDEE